MFTSKASYASRRPEFVELLLPWETRLAPKGAMYLKVGRETLKFVASVFSDDLELVFDVLESVLRRKIISVRETAVLLHTLSPALRNGATDLLASRRREVGDHNGFCTASLERKGPF